MENTIEKDTDNNRPMNGKANNPKSGCRWSKDLPQDILLGKEGGRSRHDGR